MKPCVYTRGFFVYAGLGSFPKVRFVTALPLAFLLRLFTRVVKMNKCPVLNFSEFISNDGEKLVTDSAKVAAVFGKQHGHVLRDIRNLLKELPEDDRLPNFGETVIMRENPSGGALIPSVVYTMSKDGFALLAMGFTGKKALMFKLSYIKAFNAMEAFIKNQREGLQYQYFRKELEFKNKKAQVSASAREMRRWQDDKPRMAGEMNILLEKMQPQLLPN